MISKTPKPGKWPPAAFETFREHAQRKPPCACMVCIILRRRGAQADLDRESARGPQE